SHENRSRAPQSTRVRPVLVREVGRSPSSGGATPGSSQEVWRHPLASPRAVLPARIRDDRLGAESAVARTAPCRTHKLLLNQTRKGTGGSKDRPSSHSDNGAAADRAQVESRTETRRW